MIPGFAGDSAGLCLMNELTYGKVVDVHSESNTIDVRIATDNRRLTGVPVVGMGLSGNTGSIDLPVPDTTTSRVEADKWKSLHVDGGKRDIIAIIAFVSGRPVCLGFVVPPVSQMTFPPAVGENRRIIRHHSDVYQTIDKDGNTEVYHPSGTYLRIGTAPEHEDLTGKDYDKRWKIANNTSKAVHVHLRVSNAGSEKASIDIDPQGNIKVTNVGNTQIDTTGTMKVNSGGTMDFVAGGNMSFTAPRIDWN